MRKAAFFAIVICVVSAGAYSFAGTVPYRPPGLRHPPELRDGRTLYMSDCAWCHGAGGEGTERGPDLISGANGPAMNDFMLSTGRMPIEDPREAARRRNPVYTPAQIQSIVRFTETLDAPGPAVPDPRPERGDMDLGQELYQENCAACHSTTGIGGALSSSNDTSSAPRDAEAGVAPPLDETTPRETAEAMLVGPGAMPVFGPDTFSEEEVDSIVRYVDYLQAPRNAGGLPMGKIGPWSEGAAGWLIGLGALLLLIRWLGTDQVTGVQGGAGRGAERREEPANPLVTANPPEEEMQ